MHRIDPTAQVSPHADLEDSSRGSVLEIGAESMIDSFVKVKFAGGSGDIRIGAHCYINAGTVIYSGHGVLIGDDTLVAANCTLAATNHVFAEAGRAIRTQGFAPSRGGIRIGRDAWIGAGSIILDGADIGDGCVIGAGSVVRETLPPFTVWAGRPLRQIGARR